MAKVVLWAICVLSLLGWLFTTAAAASAVHQIYGAVLLVNGTVAMAGAMILRAIELRAVAPKSAAAADPYAGA